jgi:Zn-dependent protease/predicted transcriptional regulator
MSALWYVSVVQIKGLQLLRVRGIPVLIDYSWFVIFFLVMFTMAESYFPREQSHYSTRQYWVMGAVAAVLLFASVLVHELAHAFVAVKKGIRVLSIRLFIFGGLAQVSSEPQTGKHEFLIALAGPAASMALAFFFAAVFGASMLSGSGAVSAVAWYLAGANLLLAVFNMIPGFPLDGGRILRAILWDRWDDMARATKVVSRFGNAFALFLIVLGVLQLFLTDRLISALWLVFIGLFMKQSAVGSYQAVALKQALTGVRIRQIMTANPVTVDWLTPVEELVRDFIYRHQFVSFPVFNRDAFVGMVSLDDVKQVPKELWTFKQVRDVMTPAEHVPVLHPSEDATDVLARMVTEDRGLMPVVEDGRLVGVVSKRDILNLFKIKSDLGLS